MRKVYEARLEVDAERGVAYVHLVHAHDLEALQTPTPIRIKFGHNDTFPLDLITSSARYTILPTNEYT